MGSEIDLVNDYFRRFYPPDDKLRAAEVEVGSMGRIRHCVEGYSNIFPRMVCADGLALSVQGHYGAYSMPSDDWARVYRQVEILGPPNADELFAPYEGGRCGDEMIYACVPVEVVAAVIEKHGGLAEPVGRR